MARTLLAVVRTVVAGPIIVLDTIVLGSAMVAVSARHPASPLIQRLMVVWSRVFLVAAGVKLDVAGQEHLPPGRSYVFVANHASAIDIPVNFLTADPFPIRYLAKQELFAVPILGWIMRNVRMVRTDRRAGVMAHDEINSQIAEILPLGMSLMIYPEGTRTRSGELAAFKRGAFRIAIDNQMDVVPVSIAGTRAIYPPRSKLIYGGHARAVVHPPISVAGLDHDDIGALSERAYEAVAGGLAALEAA